MKILVAGAAGAIGGRLIPQLVARGHEVVATSRRVDKLDRLRALGVEAIALDGLDAAAVHEGVGRASPDVIVNQMTALAGKANLRRFDGWFRTTNELRAVGTANLLAAAEAAGVKRFVAQSYTGWTNIRDGGRIKSEDDPLDPHPAKAQTEAMAAIKSMEQGVLAAPLDGTVLRYGNFYGPGASEVTIELVRKRRLPI